jgi:hypothetical protein
VQGRNAQHPDEDVADRPLGRATVFADNLTSGIEDAGEAALECLRIAFSRPGDLDGENRDRLPELALRRRSRLRGRSAGSGGGRSRRGEEQVEPGVLGEDPSLELL